MTRDSSEYEQYQQMLSDDPYIDRIDFIVFYNFLIFRVY